MIDIKAFNELLERYGRRYINPVIFINGNTYNEIKKSIPNLSQYAVCVSPIVPDGIYIAL